MRGSDAQAMVDRLDGHGRRLAWGLLAAGAGTLLWLYVLALWLPDVATVSGWATAWIGLDAAEGVGLVLTGLLLRRGDPRLALAAAATATLLCVDAWFDVVTAGSGGGLAIAVAMAALLELPMAALCGRLAYRAVARARRAEVAAPRPARPAPPAAEARPAPVAPGPSSCGAS